MTHPQFDLFKLVNDFLVSPLAKVLARAPRTVLSTLLALAIIIAGILAFSAANNLTVVGGLDLAGYCKSYQYDTNTEDSCSSRIDLNAACNFDHGRTDLHLVFGSASPESGVCYPPSGPAPGGIRNMTGYCQHLYQNSRTVIATVVDSTWVCQTTIDKNLACTWQYQKSGLTARNDSGGWNCYQRRFSL
jgi:hypothetical protein